MRVFTSRECDEHRVPRGFPERAERRDAVLRGARVVGDETVEVETGSIEIDDAVAAVHPDGYLERLRRAVERRDGLIDSADTPLSPGTWRAARAAVAVVLQALERAAEGEACFAVVRPPGHHAEAETAMGFCYLNNVAVAAAQARNRWGCDRVAVIDLDVHHGNGTQHIFERDPSIFYGSTHQYPFYPGTGAASETGRGPGKGSTLNLPLPAGTGDPGYREAIRGELLPAVRDFGPEVLLVSIGFDPWRRDPLGGMAVTEGGFRDWARWCRELADEICGGRILALLEGGYDLDSLEPLGRAFSEGLAGRSSGDRIP
ncbi:MAG: histone deacetylase [Thermoanaerobaculia bacterium]|nr:histone deacetylase [Thermoanaerobaculia bacterium]